MLQELNDLKVLYSNEYNVNRQSIEEARSQNEETNTKTKTRFFLLCTNTCIV